MDLLSVQREATWSSGQEDLGDAGALRGAQRGRAPGAHTQARHQDLVVGGCAFSKRLVSKGMDSQCDCRPGVGSNFPSCLFCKYCCCEL